MNVSQENNKNTNQLIQELQNKIDKNQEMLDLLKGYINVLLDRNTGIKILTDEKLLNMQETSEMVHKDMFTILERQEALLNEHKKVLLKVLENGKNEMYNNNQQVVESLQQIQLDLQEQMKNISNYTDAKIDNIYQKSLDSLGQLEANSVHFITKIQKRERSIFWIDAMKLGFCTTLIIIPTYVLLRFLLSFLDVDLP
ncbi:hypothetical protein [Bacillus cereus]|uniref:hypothetical protein n=1 Tax=Bacillus cereus TaxID=1396 RepID=UPI0006A8F919|nr:hypothetical protein [Bacillus cereus]CUB45288.1 hypothetical protein BN2127_JRS4_04721 [Bacillus cereus]